MHLFEVCQILSYLDCPDYIVCAGILHDIVEDTCYSIDDIKDNFGEKVSNIVANESENKDLSWEERKESTINNISKESLVVILVLFADMLNELF